MDRLYMCLPSHVCFEVEQFDNSAFAFVAVLVLLCCSWLVGCQQRAFAGYVRVFGPCRGQGGALVRNSQHSGLSVESRRHYVPKHEALC